MDTSVFTPLFGHVAGVPVEETLAGVLALGAVGVRLATGWLRRRLGWRSDGDKGAGHGGQPG
jgi:hypothetical protein